MTATAVRAAGIEPSVRMGGQFRAVLTPARVDATAGFLGTGYLDPGESVAEHYHPFSDEFLYVTAGVIHVVVDGEPVELEEGTALMVRRGQRHVFRGGDAGAHWVYVMAPLAPRPDLGHADTAAVPHPTSPAPAVGVAA